MKVLRSKTTFLSQYFVMCKKVLRKSNKVQVKSTLAKKYFLLGLCYFFGVLFV